MTTTYPGLARAEFLHAIAPLMGRRAEWTDADKKYVADLHELAARKGRKR